MILGLIILLRIQVPEKLLHRWDIESGIGNYLIVKGFPILDETR